MKRALATALFALLLCSMAKASDVEVKMAYLPEAGFFFWYPASLVEQHVDDNGEVLLFAMDPSENELCILRYDAGDSVTLDALAASLQNDDACADVFVADAKSIEYLTYTAEGNVNTVIVGDDRNLYEIMLRGDDTFTQTAAELIRTTLSPG